MSKKEPAQSTPDEQFPRTTSLPSQSPLYWVSQKERYLRQLAIRDIEAVTKRRLAVEEASRTEGASIDSRDILYLTELLSDVGKNEPLDLLLETTGGITDATEALVSLLQNCTTDLRVIVADAAKSNGTLLALAAKSILMGAPSELGPIEPLIQNIPCTILETKEIAATNFPLHMYGKFALNQTRTLARKLLLNGMMKDKPTLIDVAVQALSSRDTYFSHGSVIDHVEANRLGLAVEYVAPDNELWRRIWLLYCMIDFDSRKNRYLKLFEGRAKSTAIAAANSPAAAP